MEYQYKDIITTRNTENINFKSVYDIDAVRNSLINLFIIQKNEVPGKPWFGNPLNINVFDLFDVFTSNTLKSAIEGEIQKFEPRVIIEDLNVSESPENNRIIVELTYTVILNESITETIYLPFTHNSYTFLGMRNVVFVQN